VNCILLSEAEITGNLAELSDERATHIRSVLRKTVGDSIKIGRLHGPLGVGTIQQLERTGSAKQAATRCVLTCNWGDVPARPQLDLLLAVPRPKVLRRLWAQLATLGVRRIYLCNADKVERYYFDSHVIEPSTYEPLLIEGLQQAVDTHVPRVEVHRYFRRLVEDQLADFAGAKYVLDPSGGGDLRDLPEQLECVLAIGPEGGWSGFELDLLQANGFECQGFGSRILRSDTACIAAVSAMRVRSLTPVPE